MIWIYHTWSPACLFWDHILSFLEALINWLNWLKLITPHHGEMIKKQVYMHVCLFLYLMLCYLFDPHWVFNWYCLQTYLEVISMERRKKETDIQPQLCTIDSYDNTWFNFKQWLQILEVIYINSKHQTTKSLIDLE